MLLAGRAAKELEILVLRLLSELYGGHTALVVALACGPGEPGMDACQVDSRLADGERLIVVEVSVGDDLITAA